MLPRLLDLTTDVASKSVFLFGPRQTGKTTYLHAAFPQSPYFDLLRGEVFLRLSQEPGRLRQELAAGAPTAGPVIIDEIQKLPGLLDEVHNLIESRGLRFVLSGSSPAKLRRGGAHAAPSPICLRRGSEVGPAARGQCRRHPFDLLLGGSRRRSPRILWELPSARDPG
jgi:hypothetical protein